MEQKIATAWLMNSRRIQQTLQDLSRQQAAGTDRHMAVIAALKLLRTEYQGLGVKQVGDALGDLSEPELFDLARSLHPVLCSLRLQKWMKASGQQQYLAESPGPRGALARRVLLDDDAIEQVGKNTSDDLWA
jgi:hypothetical protein